MISDEKRRRQQRRADRRINQTVSRQNGSQTTGAAASRFGGDKDDPKHLSPKTAAENGSALDDVKVLADEGAALPAGGGDRHSSGTQVAIDHDIHQHGQQADSPPLQPTEIAFPLCDAAVRSSEGSEWKLADAIEAECSETGADGARNGSYSKMEAMREEIAKNLGVELSFERIRKLRKVASAFPPVPPGRRRPGVSLEGHLEAGTHEALEKIMNTAPEGTAFTREFIRRAMHPNGKTEQDKQKETERRRQIDDQRKALQDLRTQLGRQNEAQEQRYSELCRTTGTKPEPLPSLPQEEGTPRPVAETLEQSLRVLLTLHGFDPTADTLKQAIQAFVTTVLGRP
jgi:hypothetical protein